MRISRPVLLRMRNISDKILEKKKKSKHTFYVQLLFFFFENRAVYDITWKNIVEADMPHMTI